MENSKFVVILAVLTFYFEIWKSNHYPAIRSSDYMLVENSQELHPAWDPGFGFQE